MDQLRYNLVSFIYLTMSEAFKIRKNKSQKDINFNHQLRRRSPLLGTQQLPKPKTQNQHYQSKILQLQPLLKMKASIQNQTDKTQQTKLDFTQPVPHKSHSLTKQQARLEGFHLIPLDNHATLKPLAPEKENRPPNCAEVKYPTIAKINSTLLNADKTNSVALLAQLSEGLQNFRSEKEFEADACKKNSLGHKSNKLSLLKTSSRTKIAKIFGTKPQKQENYIVEESPNETEREKNANHGTKREAIKRFIIQSRNTLEDFAKIENIIAQVSQNAVTKEKKTAGRDLCEQAKEQHKPEYALNSPFLLKSTGENWGNCSTIRQQQESCSSFLSRQAMQDFIFPKQEFEPAPFLQQKFHYDRRAKVETDRIKKKFPQNFFK